jgi:hypothetical protein
MRSKEALTCTRRELSTVTALGLRSLVLLLLAVQGQYAEPSNVTGGVYVAVVSVVPTSSSRALKSASWPFSQSRRRAAVSGCASAASMSGVTPCLSARSARAPRRSSRRTMCVWPLAAAKWSGVAPVLPTMGAGVEDEEDRVLSFEYRCGSLCAYIVH